MLKLLAQLVAMALAFLAARYFQLHWALVGLCMIAAMFVMHLAWERFVFRPYEYLGTMGVSDDDPIMNEAIEQGTSTLAHFLANVYPGHAEDSIVKFRYSNKTGETEHLWGDLLEERGDLLKVYVRTFPLDPHDGFERTVDVAIDDVIDWSVEFRDGTLRGGFTNRALFRIFEREQGYLHPKFERHMARFRDLDEGGSGKS